MAIKYDNRTQNLKLPLPNPDNDQDSDCERIAQGFTMLDSFWKGFQDEQQKVKTEVAEMRAQVGEDLQKELAAIKKELEEAGKNQGNLLGTALEVDEDGYLCIYKEEGATDNVTYSISDDGYLEVSYAAG